MEALIGSRTANDAVPTPAMIAVALGVPAVRLEVLRALVGRRPARVSELARAVGCTRNGLRPHLDALEQLGALQCETVRVPGSFRPSRVYRVDAARVEEIAWSVYDAVIGEPDAIEVGA